MKSFLRGASVAVAAGTAALALMACGASDTSDTSAGGSASAGCSSDTSTVSTGPVTLTDNLGREVKLDKPAARIVALEWQQVEDVLSLCVTPVGVADVEGYTIWDTAETLPAGVTDVGVRGEPNLDALMSTNPDLVIIEASSKDDDVLKKLAKYKVPVMSTSGADTADPVKNMKDTFQLIATATGREERAATVLGEFDTALADAKADIAKADVKVSDFVYFDGWIDGGNVSLRPFGQGSLIGELGEQLGLKNVWTGKVDPQYGLGQSDIEGMTKVGDAAFFHTSTVDGDTDIMPELQKNRVWAALPAVKEGRVYAFPTGIWTFGGPRSSIQVINAYADLITS